MSSRVTSHKGCNHQSSDGGYQDHIRCAPSAIQVTHKNEAWDMVQTKIFSPDCIATKHVTANLPSWVVLHEVTLNVQAFHKV